MAGKRAKQVTDFLEALDDRPRGGLRELADAAAPVLGGRAQLESVRADDHDPLDAEARLDVVVRAARDDADERISPASLPSSARVSGGATASSGRATIGAKHAVEVEEETAFGRRRGETLEQRVGGRVHALSIGACA